MLNKKYQLKKTPKSELKYWAFKIKNNYLDLRHLKK